MKSYHDEVMALLCLIMANVTESLGIAICFGVFAAFYIVRGMYRTYKEGCK